MPVGHEDSTRRRACLRHRLLDPVRVAFAQLGGITPGSVEVAADRRDTASLLVDLQQAGLHQVQVVEKVEVLVEQSLAR